MGNGIKSVTINYTDKTRTFLGRNGRFKMYAIEVWKWNDVDTIIHLSPITSKGVNGNCELQIPKENLQEFLDQLKTFL
jgi:hypothetical protein